MNKLEDIFSKLKGILALTLILVFSSCEVKVSEVSEVESLTNEQWMIENVYFEDELILNGNPLLDGGRTENFRVRFNEDFTYDLIDFDQSEISGIWNLSSESQQLTMAGYALETWAVEVTPIRLKMNFIPPANKPSYRIRMELKPE